MKYLKSYEGVKDKLNKKIEQNKKLNKFISGSYIIFSYKSFDFLNMKETEDICLGRVIMIRKETYNKEDDYARQQYKIEHEYLDVIVLDSIGNTSIGYEKDKVRTYSINNKVFKTLYTFMSLKDAQLMFSELKENWIVKQNANKYNL